MVSNNIVVYRARVWVHLTLCWPTIVVCVCRNNSHLNWFSNKMRFRSRQFCEIKLTDRIVLFEQINFSKLVSMKTHEKLSKACGLVMQSSWFKQFIPNKWFEILQAIRINWHVVCLCFALWFAYVKSWARWRPYIQNVQPILMQSIRHIQAMW